MGRLTPGRSEESIRAFSAAGQKQPEDDADSRGRGYRDRGHEQGSHGPVQRTSGNAARRNALDKDQDLRAKRPLSESLVERVSSPHAGAPGKQIGELPPQRLVPALWRPPDACLASCRFSEILCVWNQQFDGQIDGLVLDTQQLFIRLLRDLGFRLQQVGG